MNVSDSGDSRHIRHQARVCAGHLRPSGIVFGSAGCLTGAAVMTRSGSGSAWRRTRRAGSLEIRPRPATITTIAQNLSA